MTKINKTLYIRRWYNNDIYLLINGRKEKIILVSCNMKERQCEYKNQNIREKTYCNNSFMIFDKNFTFYDDNELGVYCLMEFEDERELNAYSIVNTLMDEQT